MQYMIVYETTDRQIYHIRPHDIMAGKSGSLLSTFGKKEVEISAERLILFFQSYGYWTTFTLSELQEFYRKNNWDFNKALFGLVGGWFDDCGMFGNWITPVEVFLASDSIGNYYVTNHFINRCAKAKDPTAFRQQVDKITEVIKETIKNKSAPENSSNPS